MRRREGLLLQCTLCHKMRPRGWFTRAGRTAAQLQRYYGYCRECRAPYKALAASRRRIRAARAGSATPEQIAALWGSQHGLCALCAQAMLAGCYHVDHIVPLARGGSSRIENLQLLHARCNLRKGARVISYA